MNKKPTIGIVGIAYNSNTQFGASSENLEWLSKFGNPKIIMPWEKEISCDILYLHGGQDVYPKGQVPGYFTGNENLYQRRFNEELLPKYIESKIGIFGTCLGFQVLAMNFGCTITQNSFYHPQGKDNWDTPHSVDIINYKTNIKKLDVTSTHHQFFNIDNFNSKDLQVIAIHTDKGEDCTIVEGFQHRTLPIVGLQWHSERLYDKISNSLMQDLISIIK